MTHPPSARTRNVDQYRLLHEQRPSYGKSSYKLFSQVVLYATELRPRSVLDFGCGKSQLVDRVSSRLNCIGYRFDPAIPGFSRLPVASADLVINTDVLEHIDESEVPVILSDMAAISRHAYFCISTRPAKALLPSGENAHATVRPAEWWRKQILEHFPLCTRIPGHDDEARFVTWSPSRWTSLRAALLATGERAGKLWRKVTFRS